MREARSKAGVLPLSGHAGRDSRHNPSSASKYNGKGQEAVFFAFTKILGALLL